MYRLYVEPHTAHQQRRSFFMSEKLYGYIRVSSKEQHTDRQQIALRRYGIRDTDLFTDWQSGKDFNRPQYKKLLRKLKPDDCIVITSLDRLGRNYIEIQEQWNLITHTKKANIIVLDMPLLDTKTGKDLTGTLIADIVLQLLSYVAQTEREFIRQRQAEGIEAAKRRGVKFGRPAKEKPGLYPEVWNDWRSGQIASQKAAKKLGCAQKTFLKWAAEDLKQTKNH